MIDYVPETGSTNADLAARLRAGQGVREGDWLVADRQTSGRGRLGRTWFDGAGNFMGSSLVRLGPGDPEPGTLALVAGLALHEVLASLIPGQTVLKWPNDVLVGADKLAGVLLEGSDGAVIVGIGVNLCSAPDLPDRGATSLAALGVTITRDAFAEALAEAFARDLDRWRAYGLEPIVARWLAAGHPLGTPLRLDDGAEGAFAGLAPDGALQLRAADGTTLVVRSGEVTLAGG